MGTIRGFMIGVTCVLWAHSLSSHAGTTANDSRGRALYEYYCYQCHGYAGNARTVAAEYLDPKPRNFTTASPGTLTRLTMLRTVAEGRPGTAMKSFARVLNERQREAVVDYVRAAFMSGKVIVRRYHTAENGWSGHERNAAAFPFASGEIALDAPVESLDPPQREGRRLFLAACISCHEGSRRSPGSATWDPRALSYPRSVETCSGCHESVRHLSGRSPPADAAALAKAHGGTVPDSTAPASMGQTVFLRNCAFCHGADGSGRNWIGTFLEPHARDLRQPRIAALSEGALRRVIRDGLPGTSMPAWRDVLTPDQLDAVARHVRTVIAKRTGGAPATSPNGTAEVSAAGLTWRATQEDRGAIPE